MKKSTKKYTKSTISLWSRVRRIVARNRTVLSEPVYDWCLGQDPKKVKTDEKGIPIWK